MQCRGCGSQMDLCRETQEGLKTYLWYVCSKASCQQELLVVKSVKPKGASKPLDIPLASPTSRPTSGAAN